MKDSKETTAKFEDKTPLIEIDSILKRLEELEGRYTQLETTLEDTVTFDTLAASRRSLLAHEPRQHPSRKEQIHGKCQAIPSPPLFRIRCLRLPPAWCVVVSPLQPD